MIFENSGLGSLAFVAHYVRLSKTHFATLDARTGAYGVTKNPHEATMFTERGEAFKTMGLLQGGVARAPGDEPEVVSVNYVVPQTLRCYGDRPKLIYKHSQG